MSDPLKDRARSPWLVTLETVERYRARQRELRIAVLEPVRRPARKGRKGKSVGESQARRLVAARSGGLCEVRIPGICRGRATNWHHRVDRIHGGPWAVANGLHVCGSATTFCHGALTNPPPGRNEVFNRNGWILPASALKTVAESSVLVPAQLVYPDDPDIPDDAGIWVLLTPDGRYEPVGEESR